MRMQLVVIRTLPDGREAAVEIDCSSIDAWMRVEFMQDPEYLKQLIARTESLGEHELAAALRQTQRRLERKVTQAFREAEGETVTDGR